MAMAPCRWERLCDGGGASAPQARSSHTLTYAPELNTLVLFGGEHAPRVPLANSVHMYDMGARAWTAPAVGGGGAPSPRARVGHGAASCAGGVWVFGGRTEADEGSTLGDLWRLDLGGGAPRWAEERRSTPPPPRNYHAQVAAPSGASDAVYVFGGCGPPGVGRLADLWRLDTRAPGWEKLPPMLGAGRGGAGLAAAAGALWVVGGFSGREMGDVHRFDLAAGRWDCGNACAAPAAEGGGAAGAGCAGAGPAGAALPPRSVAAVGAAAGRLWAFGGEVEPAAGGHEVAGGFAADLWSGDPDSRQWRREEAAAGGAPAPRGWAAAAAVPGGLAVHGGVGGANERLGDLHLLRVA